MASCNSYVLSKKDKTMNEATKLELFSVLFMLLAVISIVLKNYDGLVYSLVLTVVFGGLSIIAKERK